ncbi:hypothetical protein [Mariniflexile sp. AS56]|uniref:hypothetical protein n=1 Tax=Mariniflexile sp. AS56 TaxID=3063957 RepID=UPI0026EC65C8|nr:hypothetical protein [Mariniflexile sp. AS56]MDO7172847.1 hypothetical protein [Mariniflexile sp. AS56]
MNKLKVLAFLGLLLYILSISFRLNDEDVIADGFKSIIFPVVTLLYFITVKRKSLLFTLFLVCYSMSDLMSFIAPYIPHELYYFSANTLCILAYSFLVIEVLKSISLMYVFKNYKIHLTVLTILNIYIIYVLQTIVDPFTGTSNGYYFELVYNIMMLMLLSITLLNYFYKDNLKSLYLFIGALSMVFGEVIWVANAYISERHLLSIISTTLYVLALFFFYRQSKLEKEVKRQEFGVALN